MTKKECSRFAAALALVALAAAGFTSCSKKNGGGQGDLLSQIQAKGEIVIATEGTWAPWTYHNADDTLVGFDVEVAAKIAEKLGVKATFVETEWDGIFAGLDAKRYDIAANGVEVTDERALKYDFSEPYGYIHTALITRADNNDIKSFEDLKGKKTANTLASTYSLIAESYGGIPVGVDDFDQTFNLVVHGRVDATLNADVSYYDYMKAHPDEQVKIAAVLPEAAKVSIPVRKGNETATLLAAINTAVAELRASGELSAISEKYFGSDVSGK